MILESLSRHIALKIKEADPEGPGTVDVLQYGIGLKLNWYLGLALTCILGLLFSNVIDSLIVLFAFALLRKYSGGVHLPITICSVVTGLGASLVPLVPLGTNAVIIVNLLALVIILIHGPKFYEELLQHNNDSKRYKVIAALIVISNFLVMSPLLSLAFLIQSLLILPYWKGGETQ